MREREQELIAILAAICLTASSGPSAAVDNAAAILKIVRARFPLTITGGEE